MSQDTKHVICYHPEHDNAHPFELSKVIVYFIIIIKEILSGIDEKSESRGDIKTWPHLF